MCLGKNFMKLRWCGSESVSQYVKLSVSQFDSHS